MSKNGYTKLFYDFIEATSMLDDAEIGRLTKAIVKYARGESETAEAELTGNERFVFPMFRLQIDRDAEKAEETAARSRDNGSKGGRPRKEEKPVGLSKNPENPVGFSETQKTHDKEKEKEKDNDYEKEKDLFAEDNTRATAAADTLEAYAANWITKLTPINMQELLSYRDSLTDDVIKHAIDRANGNGVSTYAYVKRILNGYVSANVRNMADALTADRDFDKAKPARAAPVQKTGQDRFNYQQHTYTESDFGSGFYYDPVKDYGKGDGS